MPDIHSSSYILSFSYLRTQVSVVPVSLGASDGAAVVLHHRVIPEKQVAPHALHRGVLFHVRRVLKVRVHRRADKVRDLGPHAPLRGEVVNLDPFLLHKLCEFKEPHMFLFNPRTP